MYEIGQRIVCIDDRFPGHFYDWGDHIPRAGEVYTVRTVTLSSHNRITDDFIPAVRLEEIVNPRLGTHPEIMFAARRFRPYARSLEEEAESAHPRVKTAAS